MQSLMRPGAHPVTHVNGLRFAGQGFSPDVKVPALQGPICMDSDSTGPGFSPDVYVPALPGPICIDVQELSAEGALHTSLGQRPRSGRRYNTYLIEG